jgi:hypothetical protein
MPSGSTRSDDEDDVAADQEPVRREGPNYWFRRALVVGGVVAVLATASIVVGRLIGSGAEEVSSGGITPEWNRIVLVDDRTGRVVVADPSGEEVARFESEVRTPNASAVVDSTVVVAGTERTAVIDLDGEDVAEFDTGTDTIARPAGSALTMIVPEADGSRALLVHGPSGDVIDTETFAPVAGARYEFADSSSSTSGRDVLVTDSGNFQSVLFSFDRDEPSFFPGLALAVDADIVVTAQNVGADATINVFDHAGEPITTARTSSVRAGMITDAGVVLVSVDGAVVVMSPSSGDISDRSQLDIGTIASGAVTTSGDRLIVTGESGTTIVGDDGGIVADLAAQRPADEAPPTGSTCISTITDEDTTETQVAVVDTTDGSVLVEAVGSTPLFADASGCVVAASTASGYDLLTGAGVQPIQTDGVALNLAPDGAALAVERDRRVFLDSTGLDGSTPDEPIDLGPRGRTVHFTQS